MSFSPSPVEQNYTIHLLEIESVDFKTKNARFHKIGKRENLFLMILNFNFEHILFLAALGNLALS